MIEIEKITQQPKNKEKIVLQPLFPNLQEPKGLFSVNENGKAVWLTISQVKEKLGFHLTNNFWCSPEDKKNLHFYDKLEDWMKLKFEKITEIAEGISISASDPEVGRSALALVDFEPGDCFGPYNGCLQTATKLRLSNRYYMSVGEEGSWLVNAKNKGSITRLFQHAPTRENLEKNYILKGDLTFDQIATANVKLTPYSTEKEGVKSQFSIILLICSDKIKVGDTICYDYTESYWLKLREKEKLFYKNGKVIPSHLYEHLFHFNLTVFPGDKIFSEGAQLSFKLPEKLLEKEIASGFFLIKFRQKQDSEIESPCFILPSIFLMRQAISQNLFTPALKHFDQLTSNKNAKKLESTLGVKQDTKQQFRLAAANGDLEKVHQLVTTHKLYDDIDCIATSENSSQQTALFNAVKNGHENVIFYLLALGASPFIRNFKGETPYSIASQTIRDGYLDPVIYLYQVPEGLEQKYVNMDTAIRTDIVMVNHKGHDKYINALKLKAMQEQNTIINPQNKN